MVKINIPRLMLKGLIAYTETFVNPAYPHTALMGEYLKFLKSLDEVEEVGRRRYYVRNVLARLINKGYIKVLAKEHIQLTTKGREYLAKLELQDFSIEKPKKWDGKYRIIIFDISEKKNKMRMLLRNRLLEWGFVRLQNSVWVYPYDCQDAIALLKSNFGVAPDVLYIVAESIENDAWLRQEFGLSKN